MFIERRVARIQFLTNKERLYACCIFWLIGPLFVREMRRYFVGQATKSPRTIRAYPSYQG